MMQQCLQLIAVALTVQNLIQVPTQVSFQKRMRYTDEAVYLRGLIFLVMSFAHLN